MKKHTRECAFNTATANNDPQFNSADVESQNNDRTEINLEDAIHDAGSFDLEIDANEASDIIMESLSPSQVTFDGNELPNFGVPETDRYFRMEMEMFHGHGEVMGGYRSACWRSRYRNDCFGLENMVGMDDAKFMFCVTSLVRGNTSKQNNLMYRMLKEIERRHGIDYVQENITIPKSGKEADRHCLKGKYAIVDLMPRPKLHVIAGHPCYRIADVISMHMALQRSIEFTEIPFPEPELGRSETVIEDEIHGCLAMKELLELMKGMESNATTNQPTYYGYFTTWHDAFLRSYMKQKLNNVWIYTLNLPESRVAKTSPYHTYCIGIGSGNLDHTPVIDWYAQEAEELMKGTSFYCGIRRKMIRVKFGCVANMSDRPEKAFSLKIMLLGDYGKIASWAAPIEPDVLADCKKCFKERIRSVLDDGHEKTSLDGSCRQCCQWDLHSNSPALKKIVPPEKYPTVAADHAPPAPEGREINLRFLKPVQQSFEWMIAAVLYAAFNVSAGVWNSGVMEVYLRTCGIATSVRKNLWRVVKGLKTSDNDDADVNNYVDPETGEISDDMDLITDKDNKIVPKIWYTKVKMNSFIDCGMHLIFHGIVAYIARVLDEFIADHGLTPTFEKIVNEHLLEIESMRLEWCKAMSLPKVKPLAENELALARLAPFLYTLFFNGTKLPERFNTKTCVITAISQMIHTMHVMICVLMSTRNVCATEIDNLVKLFLSCCHRFVRVYWEDGAHPFWANTGNFPTLLCLPNQHRRHGPVRWLWEGTSERFIQVIKKELVVMRKTPQYFGKKLNNAFVNNVLEWENERLNHGDPLNTMIPRKLRMYYQYSEYDDVRKKFEGGRALSGFMCEGRYGSKILIGYGNKRRSGLMKIAVVERIEQGKVVYGMGLPYVMCQLNIETVDGMSMSVDEVEGMITSYCLLLPYLEGKKQFKEEFAVIYDDWDVGSEDFHKEKMSVSGPAFQTDVMDAEASC